jgi:sulfate transport system ATP-binding protein
LRFAICDLRFAICDFHLSFSEFRIRHFSMSILLTDLTKRYNEHLVVNRVSLDIRDGELFVLLGGSGSGKSTVLRMIAGLTTPDAGTIELNGRDVTYLPPQARGTGFVFQNYSIFRHMTVLENVEFGLRIRKTKSNERRRRAEELLDLVGLAGLGARYPSQLSGGQQQRVALARALAYQPTVLLLDEPFGALDVKIRSQLRASLKEIQRQLKITTILVTHDQEEAFELADRIGVMDTGRLVEVGTSETLYHQPHTEFTATFIGGGNVLVGRKERDSIRLGSAALPLPADAAQTDDGSPIRVLFRPERTVLQSEPFQEHDVHVLGQGVVMEQIFAGAVRRIVLEMEGLRGVRAVAPRVMYGQSVTRIEVIQTGARALEHNFALGQKVWVGLRDFHVLEPTGLKVLLCVSQDTSGAIAAEMGSLLAQATHGPATLLHVVARPEMVAQAREYLEGLRRTYAARVPGLDVRVRVGTSAAQILLEAQEGHYEVIALGQAAGGATGYRGLGSTARQVLEQAEAPVLLVQSERPSFKHILICTRGGEPGKTDVTFGGRVARRADADATVLFVQTEHTTPEEQKRAARHLLQAEAALSVQGVRSKIKILDGGIVESILQQAAADDADLIIIGAQAPRGRPRLRWQNLATQLVGSTSRPVLVVPMSE